MVVVGVALAAAVVWLLGWLWGRWRQDAVLTVDLSERDYERALAYTEQRWRVGCGWTPAVRDETRTRQQLHARREAAHLGSSVVSFPPAGKRAG